MESTVLNVTGRMGVGKTWLLEKFRDAHPGSLQIRSPRRIGEIFSLEAVDLEHHAAVVLDELLQWDRPTLRAGVVALEAQALAQGKKLILVTQDDDDLAASGIGLATRPLRMKIEGRMPALAIAYAGRRMQFTV